MLDGYNLDIYSQVKSLEKIIMSNEIINIAIERAKQLDIENYYIGAGCITQTVWNYLSNYPLDYGIKDIDFIYFDDKNLDSQYEDRVVSKIKDLYSDLMIEVDVKNEARVHLWYEDRFGYPIRKLIIKILKLAIYNSYFKKECLYWVKLLFCLFLWCYQ